jgi:transcriptional regulator with XRE-family HTH domain
VFVKGDGKMKLGENIYRLRKAKGLSQERLAEEINVTRQTISNWELGETAPNPEQLILLSKEFAVSIDELVGNEFVLSQKGNKRGQNIMQNVYIALAIICGIIAGVWSFSANRFRYDEILMIVIAGTVVGICLGVVISYVLNLMKKTS